MTIYNLDQGVIFYFLLVVSRCSCFRATNYGFELYSYSNLFSIQFSYCSGRMPVVSSTSLLSSLRSTISNESLINIPLIIYTINLTKKEATYEDTVVKLGGL